MLRDNIPSQLASSLTPAEITLVTNLESGLETDLGPGVPPSDSPSGLLDWGSGRLIRATLLRWIISECDNNSVDLSNGLQISGALISGQLDLSHMRLLHPLLLFRCAIPHGIELVRTSVPGMYLDLSYLGKVSADGLECGGDLHLRAVTIRGELRLLGSKIGGNLSFTLPEWDAAQHTQDPARRLRDRNVAITSLINRSGYALSGDRMVCGGELILRGTRIEGQVRFPGARIGRNLSCDHIELNGYSKCALFAQGVDCDGGLSIDNGVVVGSMLISWSKFGLNASLENLEIHSELSNATGSPLSNASMTSSPSTDPLLDLSCSEFKHDLLIDGSNIAGPVFICGSEIGGNLLLRGTTITNVDGPALILEQSTIKKTLIMHSVTLRDGVVSLASTKCSGLWDDIESWLTAGSIDLDGFEYDMFRGKETTSNVEERLRWLRKDSEENFSSRPYEQLAKVYRAMGHESDRAEVLYQKHVSVRKLGARVSGTYLWNLLLEWTIGYGYKRGRLSYWMLIGLALGWLVFCLAHRQGIMVPTEAHNTANQEFLAPIYSIELMVPFLDLHQERYWLPDPTRTLGKGSLLGISLGEGVWMFHWVLICYGWLMSTLAVAAMTGLVKRE